MWSGAGVARKQRTADRYYCVSGAHGTVHDWQDCVHRGVQGHFQHGAQNEDRCSQVFWNFWTHFPIFQFNLIETCIIQTKRIWYSIYRYKALSGSFSLIGIIFKFLIDISLLLDSLCHHPQHQPQHGYWGFLYLIIIIVVLTSMVYLK